MGRFQTRSQTKPLPSALVIGSDAEALLSKDDRASVAGRRTLPQPRAFAPSQEDVLNTLEAFTDDTIEDYELKHEEPSKPAITSVPNWLYTERGLCGATKAASLWWMNLVCMISHLGLLTTTVYFSVRDNGSLATPSLTVYLTDLDWDQGSGANALIPTFEKTSGISLPALVIAFFALSALAHLMVVVFNRRQAFATGFCVDEFNANSAIITQWTGFYFLWMHQCRNPLRWVEYSFSAAIMALVFSVAGGVSHLYMLFMIFALIWCTMFFGHYAEVVCPPKDLGNDVRPKYWLKNDTNPHLLWIPGFSARFHRLIPHMLGYVPYLTVWACLLHSFFWNVSNAPEGGGPPTFVYAIIVGQFIAFSLFGITQFTLLWMERGAALFYWGEISYQFLSLFAKGLLGGILIANVLVYRSFDEAVAAAN